MQPTMIDQDRLLAALGRLIGWLETWRTPEGAYNGFVVHRYEQKRMFRIHDTPWTQAAMIRGYFNLASRSPDARWRDAMLRAADLQADRLDPGTAVYRYAGHENDRFRSLVHCALANCALMTVLPLVDSERRERYVETVRANTDRYILAALWVEEEGAFKFSEVDHYSPGEDRFVVNFNTMAAENLLRLADATGESRYRDCALRVGEWLIARWQDHRRQEQAGPAGRESGAADAGPAAPPGGLAYQYSRTRREPDDCVVVYTGLALRGIRALYDATSREEYGEMLRGAASFLLAMRDSETHLFYHTTRRGRIVPYPQFIAGAGMTLLGLLDAEPLVGDAAVPADTVEAILGRAYANGSVPSFHGKNLNRRGGARGVVWEDAVASANWNAQWFEYLARLVADPASVRVSAPSAAGRAGRWFCYRDGPRSVGIVSWWPPASACVYYARKRWSLAPVCLRVQAAKALVGRGLRRLRGRHD